MQNFDSLINSIATEGNEAAFAQRGMTMEQTSVPPSKAEIMLMQANAVMALVLPMEATVITIGKNVYDLLKANGMHKQAEAFQVVMDKAQADRAALKASQDDFWTKYPLTT